VRWRRPSGWTASSAVVAHTRRLSPAKPWRGRHSDHARSPLLLASLAATHVQSKQEREFFPPLHFLSRFASKSLSGLSLLLLVRQLILCVLFFLKPPSIQLFQHFTSAFPRLAHLLLFLEQSDASSLYPIVKATHIQLIAFPTAQYLDSIPIRLFCSQTLAFHSDHVRLGRR
jgi:hypothetical protein